MEASAVWKAIVKDRVIKNPNNARLWTLPDNISWMGEIKEFYNRVYYDEIITNISVVNKALVIGTPGIGETQFLQSLLVHLAQNARSLCQDPPSIHYLTKSGGETVRLSFMHDGEVVLVTGLPQSVDYVLSDSVDLEKPNGTVLNLVVASNNYNTFLKRIYESGGELITMPVFSFEELKCIQPSHMTNEIVKFRYDVYGGSARNFQNWKVAIAKGDALAAVITVLTLIFHDIIDKYPDEWMSMSRHISRTLLELKSGRDAALNVVNSMMKHTREEFGNEQNGTFWVSPFMKFLAAAVTQTRTGEIGDELKRIIGVSGVGNLFEYFGHLKLLNSQSPSLLKPLFPKTPRSIMPDFPEVSFQLPVARFNSIEEITNIPDGFYGLPMNDRFPLVDAVVQPNMLIQFTISPNGHNTNLTLAEKRRKLEDIRACLHETDKSKHKMMFVIPKENLRSYKFDKDLGEISQFVCLGIENWERLTSPTNRPN